MESKIGYVRLGELLGINCRCNEFEKKKKLMNLKIPTTYPLKKVLSQL